MSEREENLTVSPTRRGVLTTLAAAPLLGTLASCSLLPGEGNHP